MNLQQVLFEVPEIKPTSKVKSNDSKELHIDVIASGSKGNCTAVTFGKAIILLDAGIGFDRIQRAINFENPTAAIITHEHGDHTNKVTVNELLKRGVKVYMSEGTAQALQLEPRHNLIQLSNSNDGAEILNPDFTENGIEINFDGDNVHFHSYPAAHDAAAPISIELVINFYTIGYIVDNNEPPKFVFTPDYLLIEANHSVENLLAADIDERQKQRILHNHLSIEKASEYIDGLIRASRESKVLKFQSLKEIHLIHISKRHGNAEHFQQIIQGVVGDNVKVFTH